jgi:diguanylate cyclase (GGDEF)-like protein
MVAVSEPFDLTTVTMSQSLDRQLQPGPLPNRERSAMDVLLRCFAYEVGAETGMLLGRSEGSKTRVLAIWGLAGGKPSAPWVTNSLIGRAFDASEAIIERTPSARGSRTRENGSSTDVAVAAPVNGPAGGLGVIYAGFAGHPALPEARLRWITDSYARLAALCMEGGEGLASTLMASSVDRLTGCLSRDAALEALDVEVQRTQREDGRLSCCLLDLDEFRTINDALGRLDGNRVLAAVGEVLRSSTRPYDVVGRLEEDEFVVIFPETGLTEARHTVERMQVKIAASIGATVGIPGSVSAGVAELEEADSVQSLLEGAYRALRGAKPVGRDAEPDTAPNGRRSGRFLELTRTLLRSRRAEETQ